ncbi:hypothetical protein ACRS6B_21110 [Nocardia asteroides]
MRLIGWLRHGGIALGLLAAALLMAPLAHCALLGSGDHAHPAAAHSHAAATPFTTALVSALDDHSHVIAGLAGHHGVPHAVHCAVTPALPVGGGSSVPPLLLLLVLTAIVVVAAAYHLSSGTVRGPPVAAVPIVSGRVLLTRICIARR